jgi:hypothetical protein
VSLSTEEQNIYDFFKRKIQEIAMGNSKAKGTSTKVKQSKRPNILSLITLLRLICADTGLLPQSAVDSWKRREKDFSNDDTKFLLTPEPDMYGEDIEALQAASTGRNQPSWEPAKCTPEYTAQDRNLYHDQSTTNSAEKIRQEDKLPEAHPATSAKIETLLMNLSLQQSKSNELTPPKR